MMKKFGPEEISGRTLMKSSMHRAVRAQVNSDISFVFFFVSPFCCNVKTQLIIFPHGILRMCEALILQ